MGSTTLTTPFKDQTHYSLAKKLLPWTIYAFFPIVIFRLYFYPLQLPQSSRDRFSNTSPIIITTSSTLSLAPPPRFSPPPHLSPHKEEARADETPCDYTSGKWVSDKLGPLYNGTTCGTIKDGQNCINHGRPDFDYLYWKWKPKQCDLPRFEPNTFLQLIRNKHIAFVGDSMARNQLESLLCMLSTASVPELVYKDGEENKFRRWHFPSHNANVSVYWSPFLVKGIEKSQLGPDFNKLYLDHVDERWAGDLDHINMIVLSIGHWFLHPAVYYEGDLVLGCHYCPGLNHTEIGFYDVLRKALRTTLKTIIERRGSNGNAIDVVVTTFSPSHFEGDWDKAGACPKKKPYNESEKQLEGMDAEMRKIEVEEVNATKDNAKQFAKFRLEALDVTKLSLMRPDGHPGPYMHPFPFANGVTDRVQNDCVHWCLPGPIDTWNEILLQVVKKWEGPSERGG
ncbi:xyloglucan O-acetyltransferase 1 isoform X2 [Quercus robur]|uniref:xyloglucan O-acetyltransferase 1 isoform X2 n=1 Tax=Quercus robur TaxID=38942 RepID=UPI002163B239|nr:xyloglucan O-acetyltransferase 1 isoform X2 [Quercus robur]